MLVAALASGALGDLLPRTNQSATGVVLSANGPSLAEVNGFNLRTPAGEVLEFSVERLEVTGGGKPAAHLREHQLDGQSITVEYKVENGRLVALRYTDAE